MYTREDIAKVVELFKFKIAPINKKLVEQEQEEVKEDDYSFYLEEAWYRITNYINWTYIPHSLYYTWVNLARDILLYDLYQQGRLGIGEGEGSTEVDPNSIKKIIVGDTTLELGRSTGSDFENSYTTTADTNREVDRFVRGYLHDLNRHRKIVHFL